MAWKQRVRRMGTATAATALALTCGGDGDGPSGNTGSIQVAVNPATLSVQQGGSGSVTASLSRSGFSGAVTLAVTGLPAGVSTTVTPAQLLGTTGSGTVDVNVAATVAVGTYGATITATAQGVNQATASFQLTVSAMPNYALTAAPAALTIAAGANGGVTVNIARASFTGTIAFALLNPPAGVVGTFNPTSSTTNAAGLALSVATNVPPGTYPLTIQGTAAGAGVKTATLTLTVTAPPTGGSTVEYQYCDASAVPVFLAFQDGTSGWQAVTGSTSGGVTRFAFTLTQGRGGVLMLFRFSSTAAADVLTVGRVMSPRQMSTRRSGLRSELRARFGVAAGNARTLNRSAFADVYSTEVLYASTAELRQDGIDNCAQTRPTKTVNGAVAGVGTSQLGILSLGSSTETFQVGTSPNPVSFGDVPSGNVDFVGSRLPATGGPPDKAVVFRNLNVPDGGSLPSTIDFNGPASSVPATATATITGGGSENLEVFTTLITTNSDALFWFDLAPSQIATRPWAGLSSAAMASADFHGLIVFASPPNNPDFRVTLKYVGPVTNQSIALGPAVAAASTSQVVAGAYPRLRFQGAMAAEYNKGAAVDVFASQVAGNAFSIIATSSYLTASGNALAYDFTMPDVFGLIGFPAAARLTAGGAEVVVSAFGFTGPGIFDLTPNLGSEFKAATKTATINVP